jgi:hypothetical protein
MTAFDDMIRTKKAEIAARTKAEKDQRGKDAQALRALGAFYGVSATLTRSLARRGWYVDLSNVRTWLGSDATKALHRFNRIAGSTS